MARRKTRRIIIESDDEDEATRRTNDKDDDYLPLPDGEDADGTVPDEINFNSTDGFTLKTVKRFKQSNHAIWNRFGQLMKNGKGVDRVKDRVYCVACFSLICSFNDLMHVL